jgi:hypothetical protein
VVCWLAKPRTRGVGKEQSLTPLGVAYHADGRTERFVAFPTPDARDASKVGMLFFNGSMHLPKPR